MKFAHYVDNVTEGITYEQYCLLVDRLYVNEAENTLDLGSHGISDSVIEFFRTAKFEVTHVMRELDLSFKQVIQILKTGHMYQVLKAFAFNFKNVVQSLLQLSALVRQGLFVVVAELVKTDTFAKVRSGVMTLDQVLEAHPILKKLTGPPLAGLLIYMWMNASFTGDFDYDFDFTYIKDAFAGKFTLDDLFTSNEGVLNVATTFTGTFMSFNWLIKEGYIIIVALFYTIGKHVLHINIHTPKGMGA